MIILRLFFRGGLERKVNLSSGWSFKLSLSGRARCAVCDCSILGIGLGLIVRVRATTTVGSRVRIPRD